MSSEIVVPETPNWLQELEAKRERRLKARLGHEAGAGAPCLKCEDKCPGLDLHFWRKCCKICKCSKEEHEVQDEDIYGWAQFQLLGNKPNKIKRKIKLPGKKDEVELDWIPKGHNETVDKYLKTLPPDQLPVKGSQAAQDRKQLLQKQIPVHDIDPTLCHELSNEELKQMNDYIAQVKQTSVGVGQIVSLSNIIKANLHMLNPSEAALIASRYPKGIPLSEIVKLHSQNRANALKQRDLNQKMDKMHIQDLPKKTLQNFSPNSMITNEEHVNPWISNKVHDVNYPGYTHDINQALKGAQFSGRLPPNQNRNTRPDPNISLTELDEKFLQNPNFNPKNIPSQFLHQNALYGQPYSYKIDSYAPGDGSGINSGLNSPNKSSSLRPGESYIEENSPKKTGYSSNLSKTPRPGEIPNKNVSTFPKNTEYVGDIDPLDPKFARNLAKYPGGYKSTGDEQAPNFGTPGEDDSGRFENVEGIRKGNAQGLPNYVPGKYNVFSETLSPSKIPKNFKDLAFSTYEPAGSNPNVENIDNILSESNVDPKLAFENYAPFDHSTAPYPPYGNIGQQKYSNIQGQNVGTNDDPSKTFVPTPGFGEGYRGYNQPNIPYLNDQVPTQEGKIPYDPSNASYDKSGFTPGYNLDPNYDPSVPVLSTDKAYNQNPFYAVGEHPPYDHNTAYDKNSSGFRPDHNLAPNYDSPNTSIPTRNTDETYNQNPLYAMGQYPPPDPNNPTYDKNPTGLGPGQYTNPNSPLKALNPQNSQYSTGKKKLSELHPGSITIDEDFLHPSQVKIGAIQDINYPEIKAATAGTNDFYEDYSPDSLREILNNVKLPDCHYCKKPFEENEFAVTIDRANVLFHAQCFKCAGCNQILADNVYFYNKETDNIYCGRDYAKIRGFPRCKACDELIFTKEYCLAENNTFHLKHFCCMECDKPLAGQDYTLEDEMPYCLPCFEQSKANKCSSCDRVIKPDEMGCNLNGVHFHAVDECFACKVCKKPLMGKKLLLRDNKLYCSHDCFGIDKKQ